MRSLAIEIQQKCDLVFAPLYYRLVCLMLFLMVVFTGTRGYEFSKTWDEWMVADWLISYASGFVRRGLSGELILLASDTFGVRANIVVFIVLFSLFSSLCVLFARLLRTRQMTFWYFSLCISPGFLLFTFYDPFALGRKELLLFVAFCSWATMWAGPAYPGLRSHAVFGIVCFLITLMHEVFAFFSLYFVLLSFLMSESRGVGHRWKASLVIPCSSLLALLVIGQFSGAITDPGVCKRLIDIGAPDAVCRGILSYDVVTTNQALARFTDTFTLNMALGLAAIFPMVVLPIYLFLVANAGAPHDARKLTAVVCTLIVVSIPLFLLTRDWGRWISIHIVLSTIMCSAFLRQQHDESRNYLQLDGISAPLVAGLCVVCSMFLWSLKHCCEYEYVKVLGPIDRLLP
jgi:hypothetical protein